MNASDSSASGGTSPVETTRPETPSISPLFPLILLETMRDRDLPPETLEDEDVSISLPRRLGLSEVVRLQIQKFAGEVKAKRAQLSTTVQDLIKLVIRRPDAEEIFVEAGRRVARRFWDERSGLLRGTLRFLPRALTLRAAHRSGRKMLSRLVGPSDFAFSRRPLTFAIESTLTAEADPGGAACAFYSGAMAEHLELYTGRKYRVSHPVCRAVRNGPRCEWNIEIAG